MSRDFRDDVRTVEPECDLERAPTDPHRPWSGQRDLLDRHLDLPRGDTYERVDCPDREHLLGESDLRALATIGAFRVVPIEDLEAADDLRNADLRRLLDEGLISCDTLTDVGGSQRIASLTSEGHAVLEANRSSDGDRPEQAFYAGVVKPRTGARRPGLPRLPRGSRAHRGRGWPRHARRPRLRAETRLPAVPQSGRPPGRCDARNRSASLRRGA